MAQKKRKLKKGYRVLRGFYRTAVVLSAVVVAVYIAITFALGPPDTAGQPSDPNTQVGDFDPPTNFNGAKERKPLCYTFLLVACDDGNGNADTIMVATYDVKAKTVGMVSIPRDTMIPVESGTPKINSAYHKGIDNLKSKVEALVGFPIDFYAVVDMQAFVQLVDAVGGIEFDVPVKMFYDDTTPGKELHVHFEPGLQSLDGQAALEVARFRHNSDPNMPKDYTDVNRTATQRGILTAVAKKALSWENVTKLNEFIDIFVSNTKTNLSLKDLGYFAKEGVSVNLDADFKSATLPGDGTKKYRGYSWCYELYPEESLQALNDTVNPYTTPLTLEDVTFIKAG